MWGATLYYSTISLEMFSCNMNARYCCQGLVEELLSRAEEVLLNVWNLMHEGASLLWVQYTAEWLDAVDVYVSDWSAKSTGMEIIENVGCALGRAE